MYSWFWRLLYFTHEITSKRKDLLYLYQSVYFFPVLLHHFWNGWVFHFFPLKIQTHRQWIHRECYLNFRSLKISFKIKVDHVLQKHECSQGNRVKILLNITDKNSSSDIKFIIYHFGCLIKNSFTPNYSPCIHHCK